MDEREDDTTAVIRVWMKTAANERVVAHRTFLRTLLHEVCHHLDYDLLQLADFFHTQGFFARESSLVRQLAPKLEPVQAEPPPASPLLLLPGLDG